MATVFSHGLLVIATRGNTGLSHSVTMLKNVNLMLFLIVLVWMCPLIKNAEFAKFSRMLNYSYLAFVISCDEFGFTIG